VAVVSAGPYASLHLALNRQPHQHPTTLFFTGRMPFLPPNQQRQSTKKQKKRRKSKKLDMLRSITKQSEESVESVLKKKRKGTVGKARKGRFWQKRKVLSLE